MRIPRELVASIEDLKLCDDEPLWKVVKRVMFND